MSQHSPKIGAPVQSLAAFALSRGLVTMAEARSHIADDIAAHGLLQDFVAYQEAGLFWVFAGGPRHPPSPRCDAHAAYDRRARGPCAPAATAPTNPPPSPELMRFARFGPWIKSGRE